MARDEIESIGVPVLKPEVSIYGKPNNARVDQVGVNVFKPYRQSIFPIVKVMEFLQLLFRKIMLLCFKYPEGKLRYVLCTLGLHL